MVSETTSAKGGMDARHSLLLLALLIAFLGVYYPVLHGLVRGWGASDDNSHGFAVLPLCIYFVWQKRHELSGLALQGSRSGLPAVVVSLLCYVLGRKGEMQTLASLSMVFFIWGSALYLLGYGVVRTYLFPLLLLLFMVPVPAQVTAALTIPLQLIVTKASVGLASVAGIPIMREGNVIYLSDRTFEVVQACSGLRSIMALLMLGAVVSYWTLRSNALRAVLFVVAVPIAIAVNILRVFTLVAVFHYANIDLSHGTPHTLLGLAVFMAAMGLFLLAGKGFSLCER